MLVWQDKAQKAERPCVLTLGTFDGVHRGHRHLLEIARQHAHALGVALHVWVYHPHPRSVLRREAVPLLTTLAERLALLEAVGVDAVRVVHFSEALAGLSAETFVREWLLALEEPHLVILGYDHHFGRGRAGNAALLRGLGLAVEEVAPYESEGAIVSSSRIRGLIAAGAVDAAARLLSYPYAIQGTVVAGRGLARQLGTPTANVSWPLEKVRPLAGVYAGRAWIGPLQPIQGAGMPALLYLGVEGPLEVHLLDAEPGMLYDKPITVHFLDFMRPDEPGLSVQAVQTRIQQDLAQVRAYFQKS